MAWAAAEVAAAEVAAAAPVCECHPGGVVQAVRAPHASCGRCGRWRHFEIVGDCLEPCLGVTREVYGARQLVKLEVAPGTADGRCLHPHVGERSRWQWPHLVELPELGPLCPPASVGQRDAHLVL